MLSIKRQIFPGFIQPLFFFHLLFFPFNTPAKNKYKAWYKLWRLLSTCKSYKWVASKRLFLIYMNLLTSSLWGYSKLPKFRLNTKPENLISCIWLQRTVAWHPSPVTASSARLRLSMYIERVPYCNLLVVCRVHYGWAMVKAANLCGWRGHPLRNALAPPTRHWVPDRWLLSQTRRDAKTLNCDFKVL